MLLLDTQYVTVLVSTLVWKPNVTVLQCMSTFSASSVTQSCPTLCNPMDCSKQASLSINNSRSVLKLMFTELVMPSNHLILGLPFSSCLQSVQDQVPLQWVSSSHQVAKVLEFQLQRQSFWWIFWIDFLEDGLVGSSCSPKDSQESFPALQFKSINSSALSFLYSPTLTATHDYWKNSFD